MPSPVEVYSCQLLMQTLDLIGDEDLKEAAHVYLEAV